jgi:hypothetical protein
MVRVMMAVVLVRVALFLAFMLVLEAVVPVGKATWGTSGSPEAARANSFKAKADDRVMPVADDQAVSVGAERAHIFMRVSGCVVQNVCVRFSVAHAQAILVFRHGIVSISLIPLNHDLKVSIVPLAF